MLLFFDPGVSIYRHCCRAQAMLSGLACPFCDTPWLESALMCLSFVTSLGTLFERISPPPDILAHKQSPVLSRARFARPFFLYDAGSTRSGLAKRVESAAMVLAASLIFFS